MTNEFTFKKMKPSDFVVALSSDEGTKVGYPYRVVSIWRDENGGVGITVELPDGCGAGLNEGEYEPLTRAAPTVKPLEWECRSLNGYKRGRYAAKSPISSGWAAYILRVDGGWQYGVNVYSGVIDGLDVALDVAKMEAQSDYERRIFSALA